MFHRLSFASMVGLPNRIDGVVEFSLITGDVVVIGSIRSAADMHVDGRIEGDIFCASLVQGETSRITGSVTADSVRIAGIVDGAITARELMIGRTARIFGDISCESLTLEPGGFVTGLFIDRIAAALLVAEKQAPFGAFCNIDNLDPADYSEIEVLR